MTAYTELEMKVMKQIGGFLNYDTLEENLGDNATAFDFDEIEGFETRQLKGVIGSLVKKDILMPDDVNGDQSSELQTKVSKNTTGCL